MRRGTLFRDEGCFGRKAVFVLQESLFEHVQTSLTRRGRSRTHVNIVGFYDFFYRLDSTVLRLENTRLLCKLLSHRYLPFTNAYPILRTLTPIYRSTYSEFAFFKPSWLAFTAVLHYSIFQEPCFRNVTNHGRPQSFGKLHNGWMHSTQPHSGVRLF